MNYRIFLGLIFLLSINTSFTQPKTYFIKYKTEVEKSAIQEKINSQKLLNSTFKRGTPSQEYSINHFAKNLGKDDENLSRIIKVTFADQEKANEYLQQLQSDNTIEYIQPAITYKIESVPNDSLISEQWALEKIGAYDAWDITTGEDTVLLAIIDTGIEFFHSDIQNKIFINDGEIGIDNLGRDKKLNEIDDDNNGFVDDYMGWDFVDRVGVPSDTNAGDFHNWDNMPYDFISGSLNYHGTFVGGIAGAETNNLTGVAGVAPNIKILNIRSFDNGGSGEEDDAAAAILYAVKMGAKVINMSWGDTMFSYVLRDVIKYAYSRNVVLVASAGNRNISTPHYPSGYLEVISVSGSTEEDNVAPFAWGSTIDLVAPGIGVFSLDINNEYRYDNGTSASSPFVAAAAALILSLDDFSNEEVKQILKSTSDDIGQTGWDLKSGAGRLNLERALRVLAPSKIKFTFPSMEYATSNDDLPIRATILSPYFVKYSLELGSSILPENWQTLIDNGLNQLDEQEIYNLNLSDYAEGIYTLRLTVSFNNGRTMEERVYFHVMRTPPKVEEVGLGPLYYGDKSTIAGEFVTNQPAIMRLYYRKAGEEHFDFVSMDGFNLNNQFVKQQHYGFIPKEIVQPSTLYEIYFEAENLAGLKTIVMDSLNNNGYFKLRTEKLPEPGINSLMPFSLSNQIILFKEPVSFLSDNNNEVLSQPFIPGEDAIFFNYTIENNEFAKNNSDSITNRFPLMYGDFNNNGLKDLLTIDHEDIILLEQSQSHLFSFTKKDSTSKLYYPLIVDDLLNDGTHYLITENYTIIKRSPPEKDSLLNRYLIWKVNEDLTTTFIDSTFYVAKPDSFGSNQTSRSILVDDLDNDGLKEIWFLDSDGDLKSFVVNPNLILTPSDSFYSSGLTPPIHQDILSIGDYDGNGVKDIAVLYYTNSIAPAFLLLIISFENHIPKILTQKLFLDQSGDYGGGLSLGTNIYKSLKFVDVDDDSKDELVLNIFPYSYIIKHTNQEDKIIFYTEGSNTRNVFVGDMNQNGVNEIGFRINDEFKFFEFSNSVRTPVPVNFSGFSISSNSIKLTWQGNAEKYYVYKGLDMNQLTKIDSVNQPEYLDLNTADSTYYYYYVQAYDQTKPEPLSGSSRIIEVYSHAPSKPLNAVSNSNKSVIVTFSEKMKNVIESLQSFSIPNIGFPNSISPNNQYSYLLSFKEDLPSGEQKLIISNIKDLYNSPIATDTLTFIITPTQEVESFYVSSFEIINPYKLKIIFNFDVDESSAVNISNYIFEPANKVESVSVDPADKKIIYIQLAKEKPVGSIGREYRLKIENLISANGIQINSGAGSYIVLTSFARDLSDVYVYPSPVKFASGNEKLMFANLPQKAKITILTLEGKQLISLEENDGNGGVEFNLRDDSGNILNSGIYIFRVVRLDNQNNEVEEKIGKFAIIR